MEFHIKAPADKCKDITERVGIDFKIIAIYTSKQTKSKIFVVDSTEEEYVAVKLAYGDSVWKR